MQQPCFDGRFKLDGPVNFLFESYEAGNIKVMYMKRVMLWL